ncbi:hypothetical protein Y030_5378 [Burkholderia pseudomallei MSHR332]|nr:hypothetical protein Y030_5378 [Burkholderia pseudomallei MSHR332]
MGAGARRDARLSRVAPTLAGLGLAHDEGGTGMDGRRGRSRTARRAPGEIGWVRGAVGRRYSSSAVQQFSRPAVQPSSDSAIQRFSDSAKNNRMARTRRRSTHAQTPPARGEARPKYGCDAGKDRACIGAFATAMSAARRLVGKIADATSQRDEAAPPQRLRSAEARVKSSPPCGGGAPPYHPGAGARDAARAKPRAGGARETIAPAAARAACTACTVAPPLPSFRPGARARRATLTRSRSAGAPDRRAAPAPSRRWWPPARRARRTRARAR